MRLYTSETSTYRDALFSLPRLAGRFRLRGRDGWVISNTSACCTIFCQSKLNSLSGRSDLFLQCQISNFFSLTRSQRRRLMEQRICVVLKMVFLINFIRKSKDMFHTLFWMCFKFGCSSYGEECTVFERQYGHNLRNFQSY